VAKVVRKRQQCQTDRKGATAIYSYTGSKDCSSDSRSDVDEGHEVDERAEIHMLINMLQQHCVELDSLWITSVLCIARSNRMAPPLIPVDDGAATVRTTQSEVHEYQATKTDLHHMAHRIRTAKYLMTDLTLYATLIMSLIEPASTWQLLRWFLLWTLAAALASSPTRSVKTLAVVVATINSFSYPASNVYLQTITQMKSVLFFLRLTEVLTHPVFESLGGTFASRYLLLHHDLRRARYIASRDEQFTLRVTAAKDMIASIFWLAWVLTAFYSVKGYFADDADDDQMDFNTYLKVSLRSYLGAIRLWTFVSFCDSVYAMQLALWGIEAPKTLDKPHTSKSIREFFGRRWNLGHGREFESLGSA